MKTWIIASIIMGLLVIGGIAVVQAVTDKPVETTKTQEATGSPTCTGCGGGCTAQKNCGLSTCGAASGTGTCGCGKK